jgi:undecaprenyl-diphosphatase
MNGVDRVVFDALGQLVGRVPRFDLFMQDWVPDDVLLKGDVAMAVVWWAWFRRDEPVRDRRTTLIGAIMATAVAVILGRALGHLLPFRVRPCFDPGLGIHLPAGGHDGFRRWSSMPSDHAMVWGAIAAGVSAISTGAGILLWFVGIVLVCLPRVYVGLHFPTDILVGLAIGAAVGWAFTRYRLREALASRLLRWEKTHAGAFYACAFLVTAHLAGMFLSLRVLASRVLHGE